MRHCVNGDGALAASAKSHPPYDKVLERRHRAERRQPRAASKPDGREVARKNPHEVMRKPDPARAIEAAPRSITSKQARSANFLTRPALHLRRKLPGVAHAEVQALSRDGMQ